MTAVVFLFSFRHANLEPAPVHGNSALALPLEVAPTSGHNARISILILPIIQV